MRLPIQYACSYPDRWDAPVARLDLTAIGRLDFQKPDLDRFPCLRLAYRALEAGPSHAVVLNAANEVAVASYLEEKISFVVHSPRHRAGDGRALPGCGLDARGGPRGRSLGPALFPECGQGVRIEGLRFRF